MEENLLSQQKGKAGEDIVETILEQSGRKFTRTSNIAHHADFAIYDGNDIVLVEVKNHAKRIPLQELEKFKRDVLTREASFGLFVASSGASVCKEDVVYAGRARRPIFILQGENALRDFWFTLTGEKKFIY